MIRLHRHCRNDVTIRAVIRRLHTPKLAVGDVTLDETGSRHARDVLRLLEGTTVELFDDAGSVGSGTIIQLQPRVVVRCESVRAQSSVINLTVAAAVPKGERADWMIEKLSELGCARFTPLAASRSVVLPEGKNKRDRWMRIAIESAKQSRRAGVMQIDPLTSVQAFIDANPRAFVLDPTGESIDSASDDLAILIGPEGGWSAEELRLFDDRRLRRVRLTETILRVETAAIAAAAVIMTLAASNRARQS
jgi:16S rRNA (uracil1498-N3)-methyltransferase